MAQKYPSESNYIYAGNSPIVMIDIEGKFKIPIHQLLLKRSFAKIGVSLDWESDLQYGISVGADIFGLLSDFHFDSQRGLPKVDAYWVKLNLKISTTINDIDLHNKQIENGTGSWNSGLIRASIAQEFGVLLHTVHDFYAHSNYVELYIEYYKSQNNGAYPTSVPIYDDGIKIAGFKALMERTTYDANGKYQGLFTGEFPEDENEFWDVKNNDGNANKSDPNSHYKNNKDYANTYEGALAANAATRHVSKILKIFKDKVGDKKQFKSNTKPPAGSW